MRPGVLIVLVHAGSISFLTQTCFSSPSKTTAGFETLCEGARSYLCESWVVPSVFVDGDKLSRQSDGFPTNNEPPTSQAGLRDLNALSPFNVNFLHPS